MRFKVPKQQPESFRASALYLAGRTAGHSPERVEFVEARNLLTTDPNGAALVMDATAAKSARCRQPAYHFIITFDPKDAAAGKVTPEVKRKVADAILRDMGLTEHQALVSCLEAGGDDFIAKPYNPIILEAKIQAMHRLRRLQADHQPEPERRPRASA